MADTATIEFVETGEGRVKVECVNGDGNCLFSSLTLKYIPSLKNGSIEHKEAATKLRKTIVEHLQEKSVLIRNYEALLGAVIEWGPKYDKVELTPSILELYDNLQLSASDVIFEGIEEAQIQIKRFEDNIYKILSYLQDLAKPGFWGGVECLHAAAEILKRSIVVHKQHAPTEIFTPVWVPSEGVVKIVHRRFGKSDGRNDHYDPVVEAEQDDTIQGKPVLEKDKRKSRCASPIKTDNVVPLNCDKLPRRQEVFQEQSHSKPVSSIKPDKKISRMHVSHRRRIGQRRRRSKDTILTTNMSTLKIDVEKELQKHDIGKENNRWREILPKLDKEESNTKATTIVNNRPPLKELNVGSTNSTTPFRKILPKQLLLQGNYLVHTKEQYRQLNTPSPSLISENHPKNDPQISEQDQQLDTPSTPIQESHAGNNLPSNEQDQQLNTLPSPTQENHHRIILQTNERDQQESYDTPRRPYLSNVLKPRNLQENMNTTPASKTLAATHSPALIVQTVGKAMVLEAPSTLPQKWVMVQRDGQYVAVYINDNLEVEKSIAKVKERFQVMIHKKQVPHEHPVWELVGPNTTIPDLAHLVEKMKVCAGVNSNKYEHLWERSSFGYVDCVPSKTFRSHTCNLLITADAFCSNCHSAKKSLQAKHSKYEKKKDVELINPFKRPHKSMTSEEKSKQLQNYSKKIKNLSAAKATIQRKLENLETDGVDIGSEANNYLTKVMKKNKRRLTPLQALFWQQQVQANNCKTMQGMRWHPMLLRLAIHLNSKSRSAYEALRSTGIVNLPGQSTLRDYTHLHDEVQGIRTQNLEYLQHEMMNKCPEDRRYFSLIMDEISIRENLVFEEKTGRLIGFAHLTEVEEEIERLDSNSSTFTPQTARKMLVFMAKSLVSYSHLKTIVAAYGTTNLSSQQLYLRAWDVIKHCEFAGIKILTVVGDGASTNRKFFKMHAGKDNLDDIIYETVNIYSEDGKRPLFFLSDVPHLIKTIRNCFINKGGKLWKNGQDISFEVVKDVLSKEFRHTLREAHKITPEHLEITSFSSMKTHLAAQLISSTVADVIQLEQKPNTEELITFLKQFDKFFDCMNGCNTDEGDHKIKPDRNPYTNLDDPRFHYLETEIPQYLNSWRQSVKSRKGNFNAKERASMMLSSQTQEGILTTVYGFSNAVRYLLQQGVSYVNGRSFCQDELEIYFGKNRSKGGFSNNPDEKQFLHNDTAIRIEGAIGRQIRNGNTTYKRQKEPIQVDSSELPRRKRIRL